MGIDYVIDPRLVRGLDYYSRTVFEWVTDALGAQDAICSGGRYDGLITQLGGEPTPAIGFAMGEERVVELIQQAQGSVVAPGPDVYVVAVGDAAARESLVIAERLRDGLPGLRFEVNLGGGNFKAQFRRADRSGAKLALVLGEDELARGVAALKPLRREGSQAEAAIAELAARLPVVLKSLEE